MLTTEIKKSNSLNSFNDRERMFLHRTREGRSASSFLISTGLESSQIFLMFSSESYSPHVFIRATFSSSPHVLVGVAFFQVLIQATLSSHYHRSCILFVHLFEPYIRRSNKSHNMFVINTFVIIRFSCITFFINYKSHR